MERAEGSVNKDALCRVCVRVCVAETPKGDEECEGMYAHGLEANAQNERAHELAVEAVKIGEEAGADKVDEIEEQARFVGAYATRIRANTTSLDT